uniref:Crossover junction endonuclease MUS81 n=1 Tax=Chaetoceros debilis TaxID=122233 RepID=A0A6S8W6Q1_9STRA
MEAIDLCDSSDSKDDDYDDDDYDSDFGTGAFQKKEHRSPTLKRSCRPTTHNHSRILNEQDGKVGHVLNPARALDVSTLIVRAKASSALTSSSSLPRGRLKQSSRLVDLPRNDDSDVSDTFIDIKFPSWENNNDEMVQRNQLNRKHYQQERKDEEKETNIEKGLQNSADLSSDDSVIEILDDTLDENEQAAVAAAINSSDMNSTARYKVDADVAIRSFSMQDGANSFHARAEKIIESMECDTNSRTKSDSRNVLAATTASQHQKEVEVEIDGLSSDSEISPSLVNQDSCKSLCDHHISFSNLYKKAGDSLKSIDDKQQDCIELLSSDDEKETNNKSSTAPGAKRAPCLYSDSDSDDDLASPIFLKRRPISNRIDQTRQLLSQSNIFSTSASSTKSMVSTSVNCTKKLASNNKKVKRRKVESSDTSSRLRVKGDISNHGLQFDDYSATKKSPRVSGSSAHLDHQPSRKILETGDSGFRYNHLLSQGSFKADHAIVLSESEQSFSNPCSFATNIQIRERSGNPDQVEKNGPHSECTELFSPKECVRDNNPTTSGFDGFDLMSPAASSHGRLSVGSTMSTSIAKSRKRLKVKTPPLPVLNEIGGKLYPDIKNQCIKALIKHAKASRNILHERSSLDRSIKAINIIALHPYPIRTPEAVRSIKGVGDEMVGVLRDSYEQMKKEKKSPYNPPKGKYCAAAAAALVALLDFETDKKQEGVLCPLETLIELVNLKGHSSSRSRAIFDRDIAYYLDKNTLDPGLMQIRKLCSNGEENYVKERKRKNDCKSGVVYELLEDGRRQALALKEHASLGVISPGPFRQLASDTVDEEFGNVTVSMDFREGGGGRKRLCEMCDFFDQHQIPYVVRNLKISDYVFFVGSKLAPVLVERKSVEDVAASLYDGRWDRQQRSMRKAQYILGGGDERKCHICYLIEGDIERKIVHGGYVGRRSWQKTPQDVKNAIASLPGLGFSVMESKTILGSLHMIMRVAKEFLWLSNNGSIDCTYTYNEFIAAVGDLSDEKGDAPIDQRHKNPSPPIVESGSAVSAGVIRQQDSFNNEGCESVNYENESGLDELRERREEMLKLSMKELKERCRERDEKNSGSKSDLISQLLKKRKPEILITRSRRNQYVPKIPSCNAAILVALHLHHEPGTPLFSKENIMMLAEETGINKESMYGNAKSRYGYNGWSGMKDLTGGDPPLISVVKRKYSLTTQPNGAAGVDVAKALHIMAHRHNLCRCGRSVES